MTTDLVDAPAEAAAYEIAERALSVRPERVMRQGLSDSGKAVYRVDLADGQSVVLRTSDRPKTFAFTNNNLNVLRALGLPVQSVLALGQTETGGSYVILNWIPGRDVLHELGTMSRAQTSAVAERVVDFQRKIGSLPQAERFGWAPIGRSGNLQKWTQVFGEPASAASSDDRTIAGGLRARLCGLRARVEPYFETVRPTAFLDDLTTRNVLVQDGNLSGIIDIDFVCYGDPLLPIGATMASLAADLPEGCIFYGDELIRCWDPNVEQLRAICFYSALWALGSSQIANNSGNPQRAESLRNATDFWLSAGEAH